MSTVREALMKISAGIAELAMALDQPGSTVTPRAAAAPAPYEQSPFDADEYTPVARAVQHQEQRGAQIAQQDAALGVCPTHGTAWTVKPGGVSKAGKSYNAFWKCSGKNADDTFCNLKPTKVWADTHPIRDAA